MSYDIYLQIDTGASEPATVCDIGNMTSNVSPMWAKALGYSLGDLHGKVAGDCIDSLEKAVAHINDPANKETYEAMNPSNGWGNHETAAQYLKHVLESCRDHPKTTIYVSR